jgi:hypothetical protein
MDITLPPRKDIILLLLEFWQTSLSTLVTAPAGESIDVVSFDFIPGQNVK